jgi:hypothetical protein
MRWTPDKVHELLHYDTKTGVFTWKPRPVRPDTARTDKRWEKIAGSFSKGNGYYHIRMDGRTYPLARVAYLWVNGNGHPPT